MNKLWVLIKKEAYSLCISPLTAVSFFIFFAANTVYFFILQPFFILGRGSSDMRIFFNFVPYVCVFFIPVFTSKARPTNDADFALPVSVVEIVVSKWIVSLAALCFLLAGTIIIPIITAQYGIVDIGQVCVSYAGLLLFCSAACALGISVAFIVKNAAASFFLTVCILFSRIIITLFPVSSKVSSFFIELIRYMSLTAHLDATAKGIIDTRTFVFYLSITALFLLSAINSILQIPNNNYKHVKKSIQSKKLSMLFILFLTLCVLNSLRYYARFDFSKNKIFSVSAVSADTAQKITDKMHITYYVTPQLKKIYPQVRDIEDFLIDYSALNRHISFEILNPQDTQIEKKLENLGIFAQQIQTAEKNQTEYANIYSAIVIEYEGNIEYIPFILSTVGLEYTLDVLVKKLTLNTTQHVYVLYAGEHDFATEYPYLLPWLKGAGFIPIQIPLSDILRIPHSVPLIVLDSVLFTQEDVFALETFVSLGGSVFFAVSSHTADITNTWSVIQNPPNPLFSLLSLWGITVENAIAADISHYRISMQSKNELNPVYEYVPYPFWIHLLPQNVNKTSPITRSFYGMETYWASPLSVQKNIQVLLQTTNRAWKAYADTETSTYITDPFLLQRTAQNQVQIKNEQLIIAAAKEFEKSRIVVIGDQYFCSRMVEYTNSPQNADFLINSLLWLNKDVLMLQLYTKANTNYTLTKLIDSDDVESAKISVLIWILLFFAVFLILYVAFFAVKRFKNGEKNDRIL